MWKFSLAMALHDLRTLDLRGNCLMAGLGVKQRLAFILK
jgi:hypothetical protein